jgi:ribosomal-protein-serine acetyltransferase
MFSCVVDSQIELRMLRIQQAQPYYRVLAANRRFIGRWEGWVAATTLESTVHYIRAMVEQYTRGYGFAAAIYYRRNALLPLQLIGNTSYRINRDNHSVEIGYWLAEQYTGNGIVTRSVRALIEKAFNEDALNRVVIRSALENYASCAVAERLGFTRDGIIRGDLLLRGQFYDRAYYTLLAQDWAASQPG